MIMILIGLAIATYSMNLPFLNEYSMRGYVSFFFGVLFGKWLYKSEIHLRLWIASIAVLVVMTFVIINKPELVGRYMLTFAYYPALIIFVTYSPIEKLFAHKWIGTLGKISFDVYVWHNCLYILLYILMAIFHWKLNLNSVITMILFGVVAFLVGTLSHFTLEKYLNNIVKRYIK